LDPVYNYKFGEKRTMKFMELKKKSV